MRFSILAVFLLGAGLGCAHINNPFKDASAGIDEEMTTPSATAYSTGQAEFAAAPRRTWERSTVYAENGAVTHWPLWFEDPFEDKGNRYEPVDDIDDPDNVFAWNWVDYLHIPYGSGRFIFVNLPAWPISAVVTPPGMLMASDGRISPSIAGLMDHDAARADPAKVEPPDVNVLKTNYQGPEHDPGDVAYPGDPDRPAETQPSE